MFPIEIGYRILKEFMGLTIMVLPYFILGTAFGALMQTLRTDFVFKHLNKGWLSVINASLLGAILPGCACTTVPMADGLRAKGASLGVVAAFMLISPLLSPHTIVLTYGMLGLKFTLARVIFSFLGAIALGLAFNYLEDKKVKGFVHQKDSHGICSCCLPDEKKERLSFIKSFLEITKDLGKYFLLGMFIASVMTVLIPPEAIPKYIDSSGPFAYLVAVLLGIPIYICEGEEIPITLALLKLGLDQGPAFSFLLASVGTCIPTMLMAQKIIGKRPVALYLLFWFVFAVASGLLFSLYDGG